MMASAAPLHASIKHEGLGLGGINMPLELGGSAGVVEQVAHETRMKGARPQRPRRSPSHSSPPDLAPFAASLKSAPAPASTIPSRMSVVGAAPPAAALTPGGKRAAVKHISGGLISYPMVSRIDSTPTYTPPPAVPPIPASVLAKSVPPAPAPPATTPRIDSQKASKARPPPIKVSNSTHSGFLSPLKSRFGKGAKEKENSADKAEAEDEEKSRSRKSKVDLMIAENNAAFKAAFPHVVAAPPAAPSPDIDLNITLPSQNSTNVSDTPVGTTFAHEQAATTGIALGSPFHDPSSSTSSLEASASQARPVHRRGTSDDSPRVVQNAFARLADLEDDRPRPATMYSSGATTPGLASQSRRPSAVASTSAAQSLKSRERAKSVSGASMPSLAALGKVDDAFFAPSVGAPAPPTPGLSMSRRPSAVPRTLDSANSVGISVREQGASSALREVGRAAFGADGVTVSLRSYHRPEDLEVGWTCIPCVDEEGRTYTTWELRLKPRTTSAPPAVPPLPSAVAAAKDGAARARTPSTSAATFLNYRMNAPSLPSPVGWLDPSGMYPPTSSASRESRRPSHTSPTTPTSAIPPRKLSGRSEASSQGGSFSSESSLATALGRKPKLSVSSIATTMTDGHPPFDLEAILAKQSSGGDDDVLPSGGRHRINRSSSYAPGSDNFQRARQFSIDEEGIMARAVSFSVGPGVAHRPKSPKHHRFACYLPPATQNGGAEFAQLAQQAKRKSQQAREGTAVEGQEEEFAGPTTPSPDRRARKQSFAPDALPPPPPMPPLSASLRAYEVPSAGSDADGERDAALSTKGFLAAARATGRRKQSIAPPAALVIPPKGGDAERVSPSSSRTVVHLSPRGAPAPASGPAHARRASDVFGPVADLRTPTKPATPPPALPLPELPRAASSSDRPSSGSSGSSSFAGVGGQDTPDLDGADDSEIDPEVEDVENASIRLAQARQTRRMMSHWSETDDDDEEGDGAGETSWSRVPDAALSEVGV